MTLLVATVTAASPLQVCLDGSVTAVPSMRLATYTPTVGDRVLVALIGPQAVTFGRVL